jgi:antitoxin VapB
MSSTKVETSLNIKNPAVYRLASELARLRRVSLTRAVLEAVEHELAREKDSRRVPALAEELLTIGKRCAAHINKPTTSADHGRLLYNDRGLPR